MRVSLLYVVLGWSIEGAFRTQVQIALVVAGMDSGKMILDTFFLQSFYLGKNGITLCLFIVSLPIRADEIATQREREWERIRGAESKFSVTIIACCICMLHTCLVRLCG